VQGGGQGMFSYAADAQGSQSLEKLLRSPKLNEKTITDLLIDWEE
jgi:hypothetical protein